MKNDEFKKNLETFWRFTFNPKSCLTPSHDSLYPARLVQCFKYKFNMYKDNPYYFKPEGLITFHGSQGAGKTLTAAAVYTHQILDKFPKAILVSNIALKDRPFNAYAKMRRYNNEWQGRPQVPLCIGVDSDE